MKVTKSIQNTGADQEGIPTPPNRREREERKYDPQDLEGSALNPVDTILIYFFFIFNNFWIRWGPRRSLDPSRTQSAPFKFLDAHLKLDNRVKKLVNIKESNTYKYFLAEMGNFLIPYSSL